MSIDPIVTHNEDRDFVDEDDQHRETGLSDQERRAVEMYFSPGSRVLDLGCGTGRRIHALTEYGFEAVGVDVNSAKTSAWSTDAGGQFLVGDPAALPFDDGEFDNILFSDTGLDELDSEAERYDALREIRRVLAPGGRFVFDTHNLLRKLIPFPVTTDHLRDLARFWWRNATAGLLGTPYKRTRNAAAEDAVYHIDPIRQAHQLDVVGFEFVALLERDTLRSKYFGSTSSFVVERPDGTASGGR